MVNFTFYLRERLENYGYQTVHHMDNDLILKTGDNKRIWVCYVTKEITPEEIRRSFGFDGHVLFVVKENLIPHEIESREATPMWLRVLHGLYMGRIYVWNGRNLFGLHFDYDSGDVSESGVIQPNELLLVETGTWLRGWAGTYKLARFYDRRWWDEPVEDTRYANYGTYQRAKQQQNSEEFKRNYYGQWTPPEDGHQTKSNARAEYEQARDHYQDQQRRREQTGRYGYGEYNTPPPQQSSAPDFMTQFARAGSPSAVKALYRELAKKYHPDLNPGVDTTVEMQAVNAAYERYKL